MKPSRSRPIVMIVEDDPDLLLILRVNLEAAGFATTLAADGDTALRRIQDDHPDAVLLDLLLPFVDGWGVLAELTSRADAPPVVVCSANDGAAAVERARRMGAVDFLGKPLALDDLVAVLRKVTGIGDRDLDPAVGSTFGGLGVESLGPDGATSVG